MKRRPFVWSLVLGAMCLQWALAQGGPPILMGEVVGVADGDTITVLDAAKQQHKIRLEGIDAPESRQDYGTSAMADKVFRKHVVVRWTEKDRYGRTLGHVYLDDRWINQELIDEGWAWHYKLYSKDQRLGDAEKRARAKRVGLWADPNEPVPPWEFRNPNRQFTPSPAPDQPPGEARFWLNTQSNVRQNSSCKHYNNTRQGRHCGPNDGKACGICNG